MSSPELLSILYQAAESIHGLSVSTNDVNKLRQRFYAIREGHDALLSLRFSPSPVDPNELWILKNAKSETDETHVISG